MDAGLPKPSNLYYKLPQSVEYRWKLKWLVYYQSVPRNVPIYIWMEFWDNLLCAFLFLKSSSYGKYCLVSLWAVAPLYIITTYSYSNVHINLGFAGSWCMGCHNLFIHRFFPKQSSSRIFHVLHWNKETIYQWYFSTSHRMVLIWDNLYLNMKCIYASYFIYLLIYSAWLFSRCGRLLFRAL